MKREALDREDEQAAAAVLAQEPQTWTAGCLEPERLVDLAMGAVPEPEAVRLMAHVALCARCRREYAETVELATLASEIRDLERAAGDASAVRGAAERHRARAPFWRRWFGPGLGFALGAAAAGAAIYFGVAGPRQDRMVSALRNRETLNARLERDLAALKQANQGEAARLAAEVARLTEQSKAQGVRMARLEQDAAALQQMPLPTPEWLVTAQGGRVRSMESPAGPAPEITLLGPVDSAVVDETPALACRPVPGASRYEISLEMETSTEEVPAPRPAGAARWQVTAPLQPGRVYHWAVTADRNGKSLRSPLARLYVLGEGDRQQIRQARQRFATRPLPLAVLYARLGLKAEAEQELRKVLKTDPGHAAAQRWLRELSD